jgi:peptide/nickel transport system ATP-binding protein
MYAGELVEDAPMQELFRSPRHPYTRGLISSVSRVHKPRRGRSILRGLLQRDQLPPGCRFAPRCDFAQPRCFSEKQKLMAVAADHHVACWRWPEISVQPQPVTADSVASLPQQTGLLTVEKLDCAYEFVRGQAKPVVRGVSFDIAPQETFALVGESGSGKSTIARAVAGLIRPAAGQIAFEGSDIGRLVGARTRDQRREIQLVFQNPDASLNPRQHLLQIIGRPLEMFFALKGAKLRERVEQLLGDVRLDRSYAHRYPDELSGGERQRVAIARALAANPRLMLCDEILSALDVSVQASIIELLRALQVEHHIAYLFISHDLAVVRSLSHRVGVLYRGEMCEVGRVEEVYSPPYHPYTHTLLSAVPEIEGESRLSPAVRTDPQPTAQPQTACPFADRCPWKVGSICDDVPPPWQATSDTHALRCHIPLAELRQRETWSQGDARAAASPDVQGAVS